MVMLGSGSQPVVRVYRDRTGTGRPARRTQPDLYAALWPATQPDGRSKEADRRDGREVPEAQRRVSGVVSEDDGGIPGGASGKRRRQARGSSPESRFGPRGNDETARRPRREDRRNIHR